MNTERYKSRIKRLGNISMGIALLIFLYYAYSIITTITVLVKGGMAAGNLYGWLSAALMTAAGIVILVLALRIVWSLRGAESPFTLQNAKALRVIGWLLIGYEGVMALLSRLLSQPMAFAEAEGTTTAVTAHISMGGILIVVGLAVLAIGYVFQYGVELQQLSDETL